MECWFIANTKPKKEFIVERLFRQGGIVAYLPTYLKKGRPAPLFPGYEFVYFDYPGQEFSSAPTDATGLFKLPGLPEGRYVLGVSALGEDFNFEFQVFIKAREMGKLSLALIKRQPAMEVGLSPVYTEPEGAAVAPRKKPAAGFFTTPVGIATIVVVSGATIYGIYRAVKKEEEVSPSKR